MSTLGNDAAFPCGVDHYGGLSKREYFAALAMQGLLAGDAEFQMSASQIAVHAVDQADALIIALEYTPQSKGEPA